MKKADFQQLMTIGQQMSNFCYNVGQSRDLPDRDTWKRWTAQMWELAKEWDSVRSRTKRNVKKGRKL